MPVILSVKKEVINRIAGSLSIPEPCVQDKEDQMVLIKDVYPAFIGNSLKAIQLPQENQTENTDTMTEFEVLENPLSNDDDDPDCGNNDGIFDI